MALSNLLPNDPKNLLSDAARLRIRDALLKADLARREAMSSIDAQHRCLAPDSDFYTYSDSGSAGLEWHRAKLEGARSVVRVIAREYAQAGITGRQLSSIRGEEVESAVTSLELGSADKNVLSLDFDLAAQAEANLKIKEVLFSDVQAAMSKRGWSNVRLAQEAKVDYKTVKDYLEGTRKATAATRRLIAIALDLPDQGMPERFPRIPKPSK